ncbi:hypothetical protein OSB04_003566 [Centaurea solstitialis]|uniref:Uncharacterized protein n=1 Tax=Centaurea solstitialis TaxID=347529 RepID=A0AA38TV48_9ASTR|nr:hypothetical protein OSB04_003566 [Centaurea solstitialis]
MVVIKVVEEEVVVADSCDSCDYGGTVKFTVKIVVGSTLDAIILEEKNNSGATSIVIGSISTSPVFASARAPTWVDMPVLVSVVEDEDPARLAAFRPIGRGRSVS